MIEGLLTFTIKGADKLARGLNDYAFRQRKAAIQAMRIEGEQIKNKAQEVYVPVNDGILRGSIHVTPIKDEGYGEIQVRVVAGGAAAPWAVAVHEHPSEHSPPSWMGTGGAGSTISSPKDIGDIKSVRGRIPWSLSGRGPKFLERAMNEATNGMMQRVADYIRSQVMG